MQKTQNNINSDTKSYLVFNSSLWNLVYFLGVTEKLFTTRVKTIKKNVRNVRIKLPQLENKLEDLVEKSSSHKLSSKEEDLLIKIDEKIYDYLDIDVLAPMEIKSYRQFVDLIRVFGLIYLVAIFKGYITDIVEEIFKIHLDIMKSTKSLSSKIKDTQFSHKQNNSDFTEKIVRYLESARYLDVANYFKTNFTIDLTKSRVESEKIIEIISSRNIHIHNKGIIDQRFCKNVKDSTLKKGTYKRITQKFLINSIKNIDTIVKFIDSEVKKKLSIGETSI